MKQGLVTEARNDIDPDVAPFARKVEELGSQGLREGSPLTEVVYHSISFPLKYRMDVKFSFARGMILCYCN
jgi:hypothetical protein